MNIKFGMDNFYVRYLKRFLTQELDIPTTILGKFDKNDLAQLIKYLNLPNVKTMFEVQKEINVEFPQLQQLFNIKLLDNKIQWTSKTINLETSDFLSNNIENIKSFCESVGWELENVYSWIDKNKDLNNDGAVDTKDRQILYDIVVNENRSSYDADTLKKADINLDGFINDEDLSLLDSYIINNKLTLSINQSNRSNYFPNKEMLVFINQFDGTFLQNYAIKDNIYDDKIHENKDGIYKVALYQCKPNQKVTIAHNNSQPVNLVIGCSPATLKSNLINESFILSNIVDVTLRSGESIQYQCSNKAHWLCIQCPSDYSTISNTKTQTLQLDTGDINFDGKIDMEDYHLLARYTAIGPGSDAYKWTPTKKQLAVMNVRKDHQSPEIDIKDAEYLYRFIQGDPAIPSLGFSYYDITVDEKAGEYQNVDNLLIIDGWYDDEVNIPFSDFVLDDWIVHEKFFNYLFGIAIQKYSVSENITYLQKLLKEWYSENVYNIDSFVTGYYDDTVRNILKEYQKKTISYTTGDLNKDNKITDADLVILRNYIDDSNDYTLVKKYLTDPQKYPLTEEEILRLDRDGDGVLTENDLKILDTEISKKYSDLLRSRADINGDGYVDENDYIALQSVIENGYFIQDGKKKDLKKYDISFILGWLDVQTEALLEQEVNLSGDISEVSK